MTEFLHACQTGDDNTEKAAELWFLSHNTYGRQTDATFTKAPTGGGGDSGALYFKTQPFAPVGLAGRTVLRRIYVVTGHQFGFVRVRVTPIVDFTDILPAQAFTLSAPATAAQQRSELEVPVARIGTWVEVVVEVLAWTGRFDLMGVDLAHRPVVAAASSVVGLESPG